MSNYIMASTHKDTTTNSIVWDSEGYYTTGDANWQDIVFETSVVYNGGTIGIAPRIYEENMYLFLHISNQPAINFEEPYALASLNAQVTYDTMSIGQVQREKLVEGQEYLFRCEIKRNNFHILLNGATLFNIEYAGMPRGKVGVYGTGDTVCSKIEVHADFASGWSSNAASVNGSIASIQKESNGDAYAYLKSSDGSDYVFVEQEVQVDAGSTYAFSFNLKGVGIAKVTELNGAAPKSFNHVMSNGEWARDFFSYKMSNDCNRIKISFMTNSGNELKVNDVQVEKKAYATSYIHNDSPLEAAQREASIVTYPAKDNILYSAGSISMWVKNLSLPMAGEKVVLFEHGNTESAMRVSYASGEYVFQFGESIVKKTGAFEKDAWHHIVATWSRSELSILIDGQRTNLFGDHNFSSTESVLRIGHSGTTGFSVLNGVVDEVIIYSKVLSEEEVQAGLLSSDSLPNADSMIMRATFNYAIGSFNKSIVELGLAPAYGSPILIEKQDGTMMEKVSFFDFKTGSYRTFNEEMVVYDRTKDYIEISYDEEKVDRSSLKISVADEEGVFYGEPIQLKGRKVYLTLSEIEKEELDFKNLYVTYQLENSYTVDFNIGVPDSFRVTLGKHDGQPFKIMHEGNRFNTEKLATMVELNPMMNPNHEGFLYVTKNVEKVSSIRVRITPEDIPANGGSESLIVVEPLDSNGNYISHCHLKVFSEKGAIIPAYDEESIRIRERAGRFLYRYMAPMIKMEDIGAFEIQDNISIIDKETNVGIQVPITLTTLQEKSYEIKEGDTVESIAIKHGATLQDISIANNLKIEDLRRAISYGELTYISIPINYSAKELQKAPEEVRQGKMMAFLAEKVAEHIQGVRTSYQEALELVLDFNGDGVIDAREVAWLTENKYTAELERAYGGVTALEKENEKEG